ncbi:MAG TPA: CoA transferase [Acidocella sp.]|jgi:crotonobetainyl-CoA:carnitine CoA-transferase CaiB-like acyl-CoA transferase|uniref:CaiB/BaiF CoA transferase family protein n=1 Tax=Acidocella sp. TaxID=50710 RepID=UPI002CF1EE8D|nr:CoA transferase [Acidocella sp.]HVE23704.1 CoA transferase [Acidocella sp.]
MQHENQAGAAAPGKPYGPLTGLTVVDMSHVMAGPMCGMLLADMGADVIKLEKYPGGDDTRRSTPPSIAGEPAAFMVMNRNKRGIVLDLKAEAGREALLRLVGNADIVIENYRKGALDKLGLGYETLQARNPRLIFCSISGFGRTGPYADRGGFDLIAQGISGVMSVTGEGPGRAPVKVGPPIADIGAGLLATIGILAALYNRQQTGLGQMVDTSLLEAGISFLHWPAAIAFATGAAPGPLGSGHPLMAPYQAFRTADLPITLGAANDNNWRRLLQVLQAPDLAEDERFASNGGRMAHLPELAARLEAIFMTRKSAEWLAALDAAGVPAGPVLNVLQMADDPQVQARQMIVETAHPVAGPVKALGLPIKFSATPGEVRRPAPLYGEHTGEVLREHGFSEAEISALLESKAAFAPAELQKAAE